MAEKDDSFCEHDIEERLKKLDAQIKIPQIPDVQTVFDRAEKEKTHLLGLRNARYIATAAAVVLICISIPLITVAAKNGFVSSDNSTMGTAYDFQRVEESADAEADFDSYALVGSANGEGEEETAPAPGNEFSSNGAEDDYRNADGCSLVMDAALADYFSVARVESSSSSEKTSVTSSFTDAVSKKRSVDVEIAEDSVSIMVYDTSGESEILSAFWVEGEFQNSGFEGGCYVVSVSKKITQDEFEEGDYLPYIGDAQKGVYLLPCDDVYVNEKIEKAVINMSVEINVEDGSYKIYAALE